MKNQGWEQSEITEALRNQISEYVERIIRQELPQIPFCGYGKYLENGSRKEFEDAYFGVRKQLTALGLYLMWNAKKDAVDYFNELLWSVSNEFSWCLAAHLGFNMEGFPEEPDKIIDLFASETAATLSELVVLHEDKIHPVLRKHVINQVKERVLTPFLEKKWGWETSLNNWCAVCSGSVGMAALMIEEGDRQEAILRKVEEAMEYYLKCFGEDGETVEGIGYWVYGFGYYIYYTAMRKELDSSYKLSEATLHRIRNIAKFPQTIQISKEVFLPFSDASAKTMIPTGLVSYLNKEYGIIPPVCDQITPFDFEHCYRFAHISRNLWWTDNSAFCHRLTPTVKYFKDAQWLIQRSEHSFFAIKGGTNAEEHNHNDVGSFIVALDGELFLTDLGAGPYTAGYFGPQRYEYAHTRSYWHNVPIINGKEQVASSKQCRIHEVIIDGQAAVADMEFSDLYPIPEVTLVNRRIVSKMEDRRIFLKDRFAAKEDILIEESLVSMMKPDINQKGAVIWKSGNHKLTLIYNPDTLDCFMEEKKLKDHLNEPMLVYRLGLRLRQKSKDITVSLEFTYD